VNLRKLEPYLEIAGDCIQIAAGIILLYHFALIWLNYPHGVLIYESNKILLGFETAVFGVGVILFGVNRFKGDAKRTLKKPLS